METKRFSLVGANIDSFELREATGADEYLAAQLATQKVPEGTDGRLFGIVMADMQVALCVSKVNDKPVDQSLFPELYTKYNKRTRDAIFKRWRKMNEAAEGEEEGFPKGAGSGG